MFIFDDVEEEQEPRYPSHDFMHKQGAVVKEEAQETEQQAAQEQQHKVGNILADEYIQVDLLC